MTTPELPEDDTGPDAPEAPAASVPTQPAPIIDPRTGEPAAPLWE